MNVVDIKSSPEFLPLFLECVDRIVQSAEPLTTNYANIDLKTFLSLPMCISEGEIIAFSGLQYEPKKWGEQTARCSSRFWLHSKFRRKGIAHFLADPNWTWHNAQYLIPYQVKVARLNNLSQVFISRDRRNPRSFREFIGLVNTYSDVQFKLIDGVCDVCQIPGIIPDSCVQLVAYANLKQEQNFVLPCITYP